MDDRRTETEIALLRQALENLQSRLDDRAIENNKRLEEVENQVDALNKERAKWGGAVILVSAIGAILLWLSSVGGNIAKVIGK